jgi:phage terminase small subunit
MTPDQIALFDRLTPLQKEVATNVLSGMKPIDAYRASSGKAKDDNSRSAAVNQILGNLNVVAFMKSVQIPAVDSGIMTRDEALRRLSALARTQLSELVIFTEAEIQRPNGGTEIQTLWSIIPSALQDPEKLAAIAELTATKDGPKIKLHSPLAAIKQIAEMQGWLSPEASNPQSDNILVIKGGLPDA